MIPFLSLSLVRDNFYNISCEFHSVNTFFKLFSPVIVRSESIELNLLPSGAKS